MILLPFACDFLFGLVGCKIASNVYSLRERVFVVFLLLGLAWKLEPYKEGCFLAKLALLYLWWTCFFPFLADISQFGIKDDEKCWLLAHF